MFGYYTPVLLLQAFCLYHAYRNNTQQMWYWLIIFFPVVGCVIYLYNSFYSRHHIKNLAEGVKGVVNSNYRIEQLEKELRFSDTMKNRTNLADAYVKIGRYAEAIELYSASLQGFMADDPTLRMKLVHAHFLNRDYESAVRLGDQLGSEKSFKNAEERIAYAWALHHQGDTERATQVFDDMDRTFTNYPHRLEYCKFLLETGRRDEASAKLAELIAEFDHMDSTERRLKRNVMREIRGLYGKVNGKSS